MLDHPDNIDGSVCVLRAEDQPMFCALVPYARMAVGGWKNSASMIDAGRAALLSGIEAHGIPNYTRLFRAVTATPGRVLAPRDPTVRFSFSFSFVYISLSLSLSLSLPLSLSLSLSRLWVL